MRHLITSRFVSKPTTAKSFYSILHNHEVEGVQAEAGFGEGFFEGSLVGLEVFDFGWVDGGVKAGEVLKAGNFGLKFLLDGEVGFFDDFLGGFEHVGFGGFDHLFDEAFDG